MLFSEAFAEYVEYMKLEKRATGTIKAYLYAYSKYYSKLKDKEITDIDRPFAQLLFFDWEEAGMSVSNLYQMRKILRAFFNYLIYELEVISRNPFGRIKVKKPRPERKMLSQSDIGIMLEKAVGKWFYPALYFIASTGVRHSEMRMMEWSDVDLCNKTALIRGTKTESAYRTIALTDKLCAVLTAHKQSSVNAKYCFVGPVTNKPVSRAYFNRTINKFLDKIGLERVCIHSFRHAHATLLLENDLPVKAIQERLGWNSTSMLYNVYGHVTAKQRDRLLSAIQNEY